MDTRRHVTPGRLRRLAEELEDEGLGEITRSASPHAVLDEIDYAVRPPRHEGRRAAYGAIVLPEHGPDRWSRRTGLDVTLSPVAAHADDDARRYADGRVSFALRSVDGVDAVVVFDRSAGSERDLAVLAEATGGYVVQRRGDGLEKARGAALRDQPHERRQGQEKVDQQRGDYRHAERDQRAGGIEAGLGHDRGDEREDAVGREAHHPVGNFQHGFEDGAGEAVQGLSQFMLDL